MLATKNLANQFKDMPKEHVWVTGARRCSLSARTLIRSPDNTRWFSTSASESYLDEVELWCNKMGYGRRVDYDTFIFKNKKYRMLFLLRWS